MTTKSKQAETQFRSDVVEEKITRMIIKGDSIQGKNVISFVSKFMIDFSLCSHIDRFASPWILYIGLQHYYRFLCLDY